MDEALIQHAQHDVDGDDRRQYQQQLIRQGRRQRLGRALEGGNEAFRQMDVLLGLTDAGYRGPERRALGRIE